MNPAEQQASFLRAWARELHREHESICWRYGIELAKPMIEISGSSARWGSWDPESRTIRISEALIRKHSWDTTLNVFKHETAHQIVTELFDSGEAHGPLFERACGMIGVPGPFRKAAGDEPHGVEQAADCGTGPENIRMLEKVGKLLSLAGSGNEHEALLAMQKATELIEKYNIDRFEQNRTSDFIYTIINHRKKRTENYQRRICLILQKHFFVDVVFSSLYDPADLRTYRTIELLGAVQNVRIAEYAYHFLMNQMEILWKTYKRKTVAPGRNKRSYRLGLIKGFGDKLDLQAEQRRGARNPGSGADGKIHALIPAEDRALREFVKKRFPRLSRSRAAGVRIDRITYLAGVDDGRKLNLHRGIHRKEEYNRRLLENFS